MLQQFLEGKKKYSAFIITVLATMIPLLVSEPEAQKTLMDFIPSVAAALAGAVYIITQGRLDQTKEQQKTTQPTGAQATGAAAAAPTSALPAEPAASQPTADSFTQPEPIDLKAFHETVLSSVIGIYTESNAATIFYTARDKGRITECQDISQAVDYWQYLVQLCQSARDWLKEESDKKYGQCGWSPDLVAFMRDFNTTITSYNNLIELKEKRIDWKSKLPKWFRTLYMVGTLSAMMLGK